MDGGSITGPRPDDGQRVGREVPPPGATGRPLARPLAPRHNRPRWLVIAEEAFLPANAGGRTETMAFLQACLTRGIGCYVLVPGVAESERPVYEHALPGARFRFLPRRDRWQAQVSLRPYVIESRPFPRALARGVARESAAWGATAVIASTFRVAHIGLATARLLGLPLIIRPHNLESEYFRNFAASTSGLRRWAYRLESAKLRRYEQAIHRLPEISAFADISEDEAIRRRRLSARPVEYLPPFLPTGALSAPVTRKQATDVLFVGSLDSPNNLDGLHWFLDEVWRHVTSSNSAPAVLRVAGRNPSPALLRRLEVSPRTVVMPDLPDIGRAFEMAGVFVNPMWRGAGVNIKVVEAVGRGVPMVSTSIGLRGLGLIPDVHALVADEPLAFATAVRRLLDDRALGEQMAAAARAHILSLLDHNRLIDVLSRLAGEHGTPTG
jgi:polysaccharide biosynthesis protein PslH